MASKLYNVQKYFPTGENTLLETIKEVRADGYIKRGTFSTEIIWDKKSFIYPNAKKRKDFEKFKKGLFLFGKVRQDAFDYLKVKKTVKKIKEYPSNFKSPSLKYGHIAATDLNHAYWRIAYNKGIISKRTYLLGLEDDHKATRLAALSTLGRGRTYFLISNGAVTKQSYRVGSNKKLMEIYDLIRFTCFQYMWLLKNKLGKDFVAYKVDCIYYLNPEKNRPVIEAYLESKDIEYKHLK